MTALYAVIGSAMGVAGSVGLFMSLAAKLINILLKAATRGEIVV